MCVTEQAHGAINRVSKSRAEWAGRSRMPAPGPEEPLLCLDIPDVRRSGLREREAGEEREGDTRVSAGDQHRGSRGETVT